MVYPDNPLARCHWRCRRLLAGGCLALAQALAADTGLRFDVAAIDADSWSLNGASLTLDSADPSRLQLAVDVASLTLPEGRGTLRNVRLECALHSEAQGAWSCGAGRLLVGESPAGPQQATWQGAFTDPGNWRLDLSRLALGGGRADVRIGRKAGRWDGRVRAYRLPLDRLAMLAPEAGLPVDWGLQGRLSGTVRAAQQRAGAARLTIELVADAVGYAAPDGSQAAEQVLAKLDGQVQLAGADWRFDVAATVPSGAVYSEPLFVDAASGPLSATLLGSWQADSGTIVADAWTAGIEGTAILSGTGSMDTRPPALRELTVVARSDAADRLYATLLQPFLIGTAVDDLDVSGRIGMVLHLDADGIEQAGLELNALSLADRAERFALQNVSGSVAWDRSRVVPVSRIDVGAAGLYRIPTDPFSIQVQFFADRLSLLEPVVVPMLDGEVVLDAFELRGALFDGSAPAWQADASVRDISLERLTEVLEWPTFSGGIHGRLQDMRYAERRLTIGGGLDLRAFDGAVQVRDLEIIDPLGVAPVLRADATLRDLNLEALTRTFSFGRIEGRLDGDLDGLRLVAWQPDGFDLHLYTPADDRSRRRISQRAVQNLTELGSGVPAGLSSTVLNVFKDFGYSNIDVRILLHGDVAEIDGLARDQGGYYLVRGAGLPRIDVIGRNRSVAWKDLIGRLQQIQLEGARIE